MVPLLSGAHTGWRVSCPGVIMPYERSLGQRFAGGILDTVTVYALPPDARPFAELAIMRRPMMGSQAT